MNELETALSMLRANIDGERGGIVRDILEPFNTSCLHCLDVEFINSKKDGLLKSLEYYGGFDDIIGVLK